jgi:hypothetical protein
MFAKPRTLTETRTLAAIPGAIPEHKTSTLAAPIGPISLTHQASGQKMNKGDEVMGVGSEFRLQECRYQCCCDAKGLLVIELGQPANHRDGSGTWAD